MKYGTWIQISALREVPHPHIYVLLKFNIKILYSTFNVNYKQRNKNMKLVYNWKQNKMRKYGCVNSQAYFNDYRTSDHLGGNDYFHYYEKIEVFYAYIKFLIHAGFPTNHILLH